MYVTGRVVVGGWGGCCRVWSLVRLWGLCGVWWGGVGLLVVVRLLVIGVAEKNGKVLVGEMVEILG